MLFRSLSVASDEVENGRPAPDLNLRAISRYSILRQKEVMPKNVMIVGDTESDMKAGQAAHAQFIVGVTTGLRTRDELLANGATHVFVSVREILTLL